MIEKKVSFCFSLYFKTRLTCVLWKIVKNVVCIIDDVIIMVNFEKAVMNNFSKVLEQFNQVKCFSTFDRAFRTGTDRISGPDLAWPDMRPILLDLTRYPTKQKT